ncbi:MAG TPA: hypothetical protein VMM79_18005 [Longimicrobiales bacterium]|nr:hypothetical protein [Longimicrobiales bacterium]
MTVRGVAGRVGLLFLLALMTASCFGRPSRNAAAMAAARRITVEVENNHWSTVVIYAVINGQTVRLGEVDTGVTRALLTPAGVDPSIVQLRLRVDPIGRREIYQSGSFWVHGGSRVLLTVENDLRASSVRIA